ncbi:MAG: acyl carrier protein [Saprospiraceae bacterium]|nr:acyl carrier protein [Saprospiraceae bacterium]
MHDVAEQVKTVILDHLDLEPGQMMEEDNLYDLGADEMDIIDIMFGLQARFHIEILEEDFMHHLTVGQVIAYIHTRTSV